MKFIRFLQRASLVYFILTLSTSSELLAGSEIQAGVAQTDITPPIGYRLAGYFDERPSTGIHDPLMAKAIVIDDGKEKIALVSCDLVGLSLNISTNARAKASALTKIPVQNIVISATHSHTGPMFEGMIRKYLHETAITEHGKDSREEIDYAEFLVGRIVEAIVEANKKVQPAIVETGVAKQYGLSFNRRFHMKNGKVAFNPGQLNTNIVRAAGPIDPDVGILVVRDAKKKPLGGLTVFAMHADTIGGTEYSADYPYFLSETLKKSLGPDYISAFAAGTCGDINHINVNVKDKVKGFDVAERLGTTLGQTVLQKLRDLKKVTPSSFAVTNDIIAAPLQDVTPEKLEWAKSKRQLVADPKTDFFTKVEVVKTLDIVGQDSHRPMEVQVFRLDKDTALVSLPCEIFVEIGLAIKEQSPFKNTMVLSICNDRPSYVPTKKAFIEGSYEVTNARVKPGVGEMLTETAVELLREAKE